jgi:hypothetical protein
MSAIHRQPDRSRAAVMPRPGSLRPGLRALAVVAGYGLLLVALTIVLFYPNGWAPIALATGAALLLSFDRKLGPLPAALFVMLTMPVGRGSEVGLPRILGDVPIRAHDLVPLVGVGLALPAVLRRLRHPVTVRWSAVVPVAVFGAVGLVALAIGVLGDQAMRDVVRDTRWWAFYGVGLVALLAGTSRPAIMRALVWGMTIYAAVLLIGLLMPMFHGGLKYGAYAYDPRLRLHYGQAVFLIPAAAIVADRLVRHPRLADGALLALLAAGIGVTLTRTLLAGVVGVVAVVAVWAALEVTRGDGSRRLRSVGLRAAAAVLAVGVGIGAGFGAYSFGITIWTPDWAYAEDTGSGISGSPTETRPVRPSLGRVFDDTEGSGFRAQAGGRLTSYGLAFSDVAASPVLGHGMGQQARIPWAWGGFRAREAGSQPGVDNAYLTVGLKAGAVGIAAFLAMMLWPLRQLMQPSRRRMRAWFVPAWLAILGLTLLQSFAVSGYAPFMLAMLVVLPGLGSAAGRRHRRD